MYDVASTGSVHLDLVLVVYDVACTGSVCSSGSGFGCCCFVFLLLFWEEGKKRKGGGGGGVTVEICVNFNLTDSLCLVHFMCMNTLKFSK